MVNVIQERISLYSLAIFNKPSLKILSKYRISAQTNGRTTEHRQILLNFFVSKLTAYIFYLCLWIHIFIHLSAMVSENPSREQSTGIIQKKSPPNA